MRIQVTKEGDEHINIISEWKVSSIALDRIGRRLKYRLEETGLLQVG